VELLGVTVGVMFLITEMYRVLGKKFWIVGFGLLCLVDILVEGSPLSI